MDDLDLENIDTTVPSIREPLKQELIDNLDMWIDELDDFKSKLIDLNEQLRRVL